MSHINYLPADKHTTGDTGYIVDDYPYGFNQRTKIRFWVETNPKHGQRLCSQTLNPKTQKWNTVKCGVYKSVVRLYVNEINGHIGKSEYREYSLVDYDIAISLGVFEGTNYPYEERMKMVLLNGIRFIPNHGHNLTELSKKSFSEVRKIYEGISV